jgi:hypothetical protein
MAMPTGGAWPPPPGDPSLGALGGALGGIRGRRRPVSTESIAAWTVSAAADLIAALDALTEPPPLEDE